MVEAAECGQKEVLEFLIEKGADVNGTHFRFRPLEGAATFGHYECLDVLLQAGADVNAVDSMGCTALFMASISGKCFVC